MLTQKARVDELREELRRDPSLARHAEPHNQWTPLHLAARCANHAALQTLLKHEPVQIDARDKAFRTPLHLAARADAAVEIEPRDAIEALRLLLRAGARITARDQFGLTALHHAAHAGHAASVEFLLSLNTSLQMSRAPIEADTVAEERPLHLAAQGMHSITVRCLLEHGAHPEKTNYLNQTALHLVALAGDAPAALETARELCDRRWRVNVNAADAEGETPLHLAARHGHNRMVMRLLGAHDAPRRAGGRVTEPEPRDGRGRTPAEAARAEGFDDVACALDAAAAMRRDREARSEAEMHEALLAAMRKSRLDASNGMGPVAEERSDADDGEYDED